LPDLLFEMHLCGCFLPKEDGWVWLCSNCKE
jgi:hypothetical protein